MSLAHLRKTPERNAAFLNRLAHYADLSPGEADLVRALSTSTRYAIGKEIPEARWANSADVAVEGWAVRSRLLQDGRRQIVNIILPGDVLGALATPAYSELHYTTAITTVTTVNVSALLAAVDSGGEAYAGLREGLRRIRAADAFRMLEQVVRLGQLSAYQRTVHLLLELGDRLVCCGLSEGRTFLLPMTQGAMADHLGLSIVHVNRTLQQLRQERMIDFSGGRVTILQPDRMVAVADFRASPSSGAPPPHSAV